uniref:Gustatory receptor n=1 Tax=Anopheles culicifacies TaxID=139723 RepID=A0A182LW69_9DIPT
MSSLYRQHAGIFRIASLLYFTPCSYNEQLGRFEARKKNLIVLVVVLAVMIPFWVFDIHLMANTFLSTYTTVNAAVGSIELLIYVSVVMCTMLNVFVKRKRMTKLMNVLFRPERILDRCSRTQYLDRYNENRKIGIFSILIAIGFCFKFAYYDALAPKILTVMIATRFLAMWVLVFVYRLHVRAIALRMEQLRTLYASDDIEQHLNYFLDRYDRYSEQIAEVDRCYSFPVMMVFLLVMMQLIYLAEDLYTMIETRTFVLVEETALCTRHFDDYRLKNTRAAKQIQKFLLKNLHQKKKFSACGFFDIDNTVIYMVFSSIVTYLVILIQFKQLETDLTQVDFNVTSNATTN